MITKMWFPICTELCTVITLTFAKNDLFTREFQRKISNIGLFFFVVFDRDDVGMNHVWFPPQSYF